MILNVRGCSNKLGIIISYLVENEEKTGYKSFNAKKIIVKNKVDMLTSIKKTLKLSRKLPEINASVFVSTINAVGKENIIDTSLKIIVKSINDENMQPTMLTLSHVYFNNKPLPQIKAINIINDNMYFMIKVGSNYTLEPIKNERIKCMIVTNSLVNLYRRIKQGGNFPKTVFKKNCIPKSRFTGDVIRNAYRSYNENEDIPTQEEEIVEITADSRNFFTAIPTFSNNAWCSPSINIPRTERERVEQRERVAASLYTYTGPTETNEAEEIPTDTENTVTVTESPDIDEEESFTLIETPIERVEQRERVATGPTETNEAEEIPTDTESPDINEEERPIETPQPTMVNDEDEEEDRQARINLTAITERCANLETQEREVEEERQEERRDQLETNEYEDFIARSFRTNSTNTTRRVVNTEERILIGQAEPVERPRQVGERRNSFVNYLRNNQSAAFGAFRENNNTDNNHH